jgi:hypothetical protein
MQRCLFLVYPEATTVTLLGLTHRTKRLLSEGA